MNFKKSFFLLIFCFSFFCLPAMAEQVIQGGVQLEWTLLNQEERLKSINYYKEKLFNNVQEKIDIKNANLPKKDTNFIENRGLLKNNMTSLPDKQLAGFYFMDKVLVIYGIKYTADKYHIYYYDAMGNLRYFDILDKPHDEYPHIAYQYRKNGKLVGASYYISEYDQYVYDEKGKFKGRWYGDRLYDKKAKIIMTRKLPE